MQQSDNQCIAKCKKSARIWNEMVLCFEFSSYAKAIVKLLQKNLFLTHLDFSLFAGKGSKKLRDNAFICKLITFCTLKSWA